MPRNKYPEETVKKILEVSLKLFIEKGFEQTTVLDIVENLGGLTRGAFYHHFKTKEDVLSAILKEKYNEYNAFEEIADDKSLNGLEKFQTAIKNALKHDLPDKKSSTESVIAVPLLSNPRFLVEHIKSNHKNVETLSNIIKEGMQDGSIRKDNNKLLAELYLLLTNIWMLPSVFPATKSEFAAKGAFVSQLFELLGCPVVDEELEELYFQVYETVYGSR